MTAPLRPAILARARGRTSETAGGVGRGERAFGPTILSDLLVTIRTTASVAWRSTASRSGTTSRTTVGGRGAAGAGTPAGGAWDGVDRACDGPTTTRARAEASPSEPRIRRVLLPTGDTAWRFWKKVGRKSNRACTRTGSAWAVERTVGWGRDLLSRRHVAVVAARGGQVHVAARRE